MDLATHNSYSPVEFPERRRLPACLSVCLDQKRVYMQAKGKETIRMQAKLVAVCLSDGNSLQIAHLEWLQLKRICCAGLQHNGFFFPVAFPWRVRQILSRCVTRQFERLADIER